jgi:hypothetical protein
MKDLEVVYMAMTTIAKTMCIGSTELKSKEFNGLVVKNVFSKHIFLT